MQCEICAFKNPKATATAVIMKDGKILLLKRNEEPFFGKWDLPGGYMQENQTPEQALLRELKEEIGVAAKLYFIGWFPGKAMWKEEEFPIISNVFLADILGDINLNLKENTEYKWHDISGLDVNDVAFDSNQNIIKHLKEKFVIDYPALLNLISQLDSSAVVKEINFYRSMLEGHLSKKIVDGKLVGVGWIFPRQTLLRNQAVLEDIIVDNSERGKGYGKDITLDLMEWAKNNGIEVIELTTNPARVAANSLYQKVGFKLHPTNHYLYKI